MWVAKQEHRPIYKNVPWRAVLSRFAQLACWWFLGVSLICSNFRVRVAKFVWKFRTLIPIITLLVLCMCSLLLETIIWLLALIWICIIYTNKKQNYKKHSHTKWSSCWSLSIVNWASLWENRSLGFPTRSDTNRAVQPQKMTRGLKFRI